MIVDERSLSYSRFCEVLRLHGPTLNLLFEQARAAPLRERKMLAEMDGDGSLWLLDDLNLGTVARDAFAGAIASALAGFLRVLWSETNAGKNDWKELGPQLYGYSVPQLIAAAEDNAQHFDEWAKSNPLTPQHVRSIKVIAAVLQVPIKKNAKNHPFGRSVCWNVLEMLSENAGYGKIDQLVRDYGKALATKYGLGGV